MKREGLDHPKLHAVAERLEARRRVPRGFGLIAATGLAERLFGYTAKHCPDGRVGRYGAAALARGVAWPADPDELVEILAGYLDGAGDALVVHDWPDHADRHVQRALVRRLERFADGTAPRLSYAEPDERARWLERFPEDRRDTRRDTRRAPAGIEPEPEPEPDKRRTSERARTQEAPPAAGRPDGLSSRGEPDDVDAYVEEIRERLRDRSTDAGFLRLIVERIPRRDLERALHEAWGRFRDGMVRNPTAYFVELARKRAVELGIPLPESRKVRARAAGKREVRA